MLVFIFFYIFCIFLSVYIIVEISHLQLDKLNSELSNDAWVVSMPSTKVTIVDKTDFLNEIALTD